MEIFSQAGAVILSRWFHVLAGVTWVGLLYYFNVVQVPSFAQFEAASRTDAIQKLVPRALWWFRWAAVLTVLTGILILGSQKQFNGDYFQTSSGTSILTGILLALVMFMNVWMVIWPRQQIVIASAQRVAGGGEADPAAAPAGRAALLASRTNTLLSIPMLFFMVSTSHFSGNYQADHLLLYWVIVLAIVVVIELNALGILGGTGPGPTKVPLETHRNTIIAGFVLWVVLLLLWEILMKH